MNYFVSGTGSRVDTYFGNLDSPELPEHSVKLRFPGNTNYGMFLQVEVWETTMNVSFWLDDGRKAPYVVTQSVPVVLDSSSPPCYLCFHFLVLHFPDMLYLS